jgi:hypothetical protein
LSSGEDVAKIVPESARLKIVKKEQGAVVKVDAFPFTRYGTLAATVMTTRSRIASALFATLLVSFLDAAAFRPATASRRRSRKTGVLPIRFLHNAEMIQILYCLIYHHAAMPLLFTNLVLIETR